MTIWMIFDPLFDLHCMDMITRHCKGATVLSYTYKTIETKYLINARSHKRCHKVDHYFFWYSVCPVSVCNSQVDIAKYLRVSDSYVTVARQNNYIRMAVTSTINFIIRQSELYQYNLWFSNKMWTVNLYERESCLVSLACTAKNQFLILRKYYLF